MSSTTAPGVHMTTSVSRRRPQTGVVPGTVFMPAITEKGPHAAAVEVSSIAEFESVFGGAVAESSAHAELKAKFAEGAPRAFIARIVGAAPVLADIDLSNGTTTALTVTASEYGAYWNDTTVQVAASGGNFTLTIVEPDGTILSSGTLADLDAAVTWGATLDHFTIAKTGTTDPVTAAAAALTGGDDDANGVLEAQRITARALFGRSLGCGTLHEPGSTGTTAHTALMAHADANNRLALLDVASGTSVANIVTHAETLQDLTGARRSKLNASWARVRGATAGTTDLVSFSSLEAGMLGRNDAAGTPVGQPAAGGFGQPVGALSLEVEFTDDDRGTLNDAHANVAISEDGTIAGYGNRSLSTVDGEKQFSIARTLMVIEAEAQLEGRKYVHRMVDGEGHVLAKYLKDLIGVCQRHHKDGSLYGATEADAFRVQVFEVNTDESLLDGILESAIDVRPAGSAEFVRINITSHADTIGA